MIAYTQQLYSGTDIGEGSGDSHSTPVNTKHAKEAIFFLDITKTSGTDETLIVYIKVYDPIGDNWHLLATFADTNNGTGYTGETTDVGYAYYGLGEKIAIDWTIDGTNTPLFTFTVNATFKER